jgi:hypothetical protein
MSFGGSVFSRMVFVLIWTCFFVVLAVAGVRCICDGMDIRWWTILYIVSSIIESLARARKTKDVVFVISLLSYSACYQISPWYRLPSD